MNAGSWSAVAAHQDHARLPDGRVLTFGSNQLVEQVLHKIYDIWDPKTGVHLTTTDAIATDEFCSAEILDPITDDLVIAGGDGRPQGNVNKGVVDVNTFDYRSGGLTASPTGHLNFPRWYGSLISLGGGYLLAIGGENSGIPLFPVGTGTPELYTPGQGWTALPGAYSADIATNCLYPRIWESSNGKIFGFSTGAFNAGTVFTITTTGRGSVTNLGHTPFASETYDPTAMFAPDKILTLDKNGTAWIMDVNRAVRLLLDKWRRSEPRLFGLRSCRWHSLLDGRQQQPRPPVRAMLQRRPTTPRSGTLPPASGPTTPAPQLVASITQIPCSYPMVLFYRPAAAPLAL